MCKNNTEENMLLIQWPEAKCNVLLPQKNFSDDWKHNMLIVASQLFTNSIFSGL
jgi:hypothetical protein